MLKHLLQEFRGVFLEFLENRLVFVELGLLCGGEIPAQGDNLKLLDSLVDSYLVKKNVGSLESNDIVLWRKKNVFVLVHKVEIVYAWLQEIRVLDYIFFFLLLIP